MGVNILLNAENVHEVLAASYLQHSHAISVAHGRICDVIAGPVCVPWDDLALGRPWYTSENMAVVFHASAFHAGFALLRNEDT